jgi:hypothetical protein
LSIQGAWAIAARNVVLQELLNLRKADRYSRSLLNFARSAPRSEDRAVGFKPGFRVRRADAF